MGDFSAKLVQCDGSLLIFLKDIGYSMYDIHKPWNKDSINW